MAKFVFVDGARRSWAPFFRKSRPQAEQGAASAAGTTTRGRFRWRLGTTLVAAGVLSLAYGAAVYFWHDPVTDVYARWKQRGLAADIEKTFAEYRAAATGSTELVGSTDQPAGAPDQAPAAGGEGADVQAAVQTDALRFADAVEPGQPIGRLVVPRLGVKPVFVNGTEWGRDLSRGPGRYPQTSFPGLGGVTAIAGHRTTFGAWFRHIDELRAGDEITLRMPYGTFVYRVTGHEIVANDDWRIIRPRAEETLVLSACHPLYGASQRWVVFATLERVDSPRGTYTPRPAAA